MFQLRTACIVLLAGCAGCRQANGRQADLCFNPSSAFVYNLSVTTINNQQWIYQDKPQQTVDTGKTDYHFQLLRKTDTAFLVKLAFDNFSRQTGQYNFNTNVQAGSLAAANKNPGLLYNYLLHFAKGMYVTVWMNKKGRPLQVNGVARLVNSVAQISGVPENITRRYLENYISDAVIKDALNQLFCFIPGKPKILDQSWVENIMLLSAAPVKRSSAFMKGKLTGSISAGYSTGIPYSWSAKAETITTTDNYEITCRQAFTASITTTKP